MGNGPASAEVFPVSYGVTVNTKGAVRSTPGPLCDLSQGWSQGRLQLVPLRASLTVGAGVTIGAGDNLEGKSV